MGKPELINIISTFPETTLENIILDNVREIFFSGDWGTADAIVEYILASSTDVSLQGKTAFFGIFAAVRARDLKKALDRYDFLDKLEKTDANICLLADALFHLSDLLLPDQHSFLAGLWMKKIRSGLSVLAQEKYARIGVMLHMQFMNDCNTQQCENIIKIMKSCLEGSILSQCREQIKRLTAEEK